MPTPRRTSSPSRPAALAEPRRRLPYETLKQAILSGELEPGQPLVEVALAKWCGVSRTPIREAILRLEQDGLVGRDARGLVVRARSPEEILDLYDTRIVLESAAARVAAERRTDHDVRQLQWKLAYCHDVSAKDNEAMVDANNQFHQAVWLSTHNESLIDLLERLNLHLARYPGTTLAAKGRWEKALAEHDALADAIQRRDGDAAAAVAHDHFSAARDIRLALFAQQNFQPR